jgi:PD-(D/E)XK nuclease superfamily
MNPSDLGLKHFSPYSLNLWRSNPGAWAYRYVGGVKDETSPKMLVGKAVENGLEFLLRGHELPVACEVALSDFDLNVATSERPSDVSTTNADEVTESRALIEPMLTMLKGWNPPGQLFATQLRCECYFDPVPIPIIGYPDYCFDGLDIDLKTTKACPSEPRANNVRQAAIYRYARQKLGGILYVTDKKLRYFEVTDAMRDEALEEVRATAMSLYKFIGLCRTKADFLQSLIPNWDDWQSPPKTKVRLEDVLLGG